MAEIDEVTLYNLYNQSRGGVWTSNLKELDEIRLRLKDMDKKLLNMERRLSKLESKPRRK